MEKECREYAQRVAEEIESIYNGTTEEENDDGEKTNSKTLSLSIWKWNVDISARFLKGFRSKNPIP